ncbi:GH92 family glycosyl hydrolase [Paenibacillus sp. FSL H8-0122]|uniref:GH92 family glycosyl hydrolase n=1 Tax=Paenibacillus sp. FSL H8-0122 TaxID=2954510 RepID=UPI0030F8EF29
MSKRRVDHVDPFIGVDGENNCLCGPYLPNSIVRLGPDTLPPHLSHGYDSSRPIIRFSHTHVSGTGGGGRYGNVGFTPYTGMPRFQLDPYEKGDEHAEAGYYSVKLLPAAIQAELTSTMRTGVHRYSYPADASAGLLIDGGAVIQVGGDEPGKTTGVSTGGYIEVLSEYELAGRCDLRGGWGHEFPYSVYFYIRFDQPIQSHMLMDAGGVRQGASVDGPNCKASLSFGNCGVLVAKTGISYVSTGKARASVDREASAGFDDIRQAASNIWEDKLSRATVEGGSGEHTRLFYTLMTRLFCMPSDLGVDDENFAWESGVRHYTDLYALWDSVRNANSLITLLDPQLEADILNCLLDIADHTGWLPDAWIMGHSAMIQGGSSADILFCEAALKKLEGIDYAKALKQMRKNNEVPSPDTWLYGRHLKDYHSLGYLSTDVKKNCVSRHMEYAYQDWCIGRLAEELGQAETAAEYYDSSKKLWNLWREDLRTFAPRRPDGEWVKSFDPESCLPDSWNDPYFYEGTSLQWSFSTHHDFHGLVERHGGKEAFIRHLDYFFDGGFYNSKETMLHIPYLYIYAGRPDKAADRVRECLETYFKAERDGLGDNEDMGCQSAFFICSAMGLYPLMGQDLYFLVPPVFNKVTLLLGAQANPVPLTIETIGEGSGSGKRYILSASLNGQALNRAWVRHEEIAGGGTILLELGAEPGEWGSLIPPSPLAEREPDKQPSR